jgi:aspartokinase
VRDQTLLKQLEAEIERDCEGLRTFLFAAQVIDEISPRSRDSIIGIGERLACKLIAAVLRDRVSLSFLHAPYGTHPNNVIGSRFRVRVL